MLFAEVCNEKNIYDETTEDIKKKPAAAMHCYRRECTRTRGKYEKNFTAHTACFCRFGDDCFCAG